MNRVQSFGYAVRLRRLELGLKQTELAERAGLSPNFISLVERGLSNAAIDTVFSIADALETTAAALLEKAESHATRLGRR